MKYIELKTIQSGAYPGNEFNRYFQKKFGDKMELTIDNLEIMLEDDWNCAVCLNLCIPEGVERKEFIWLDGNDIKTIYQKLDDHIGGKRTLVDKIIAQVYH
jgi:hypothetical protein